MAFQHRLKIYWFESVLKNTLRFLCSMGKCVWVLFLFNTFHSSIGAATLQDSNKCIFCQKSLQNQKKYSEHLFYFSFNFATFRYEDLELFKELEPADLDYLGIINNDHRAKLLTAVQLLHDIDVISDGDVAGSSSENDETRFNQINNKKHGSSPFGRRHFPRDSGCYEGSPVPNVQSHQATVIDETVNSLDDVVAQCSNEILKRVESARRMKDEKTSSIPMKGVQRVAKKGLLGGGTVLGSNGDDTLSRGGALSEKSSDSGVSSSSLSSGPLKNNS